MRRSSADVVSSHDLLPASIRRAEARDPEAVIRLLEPLVHEPRRERMRAVFAERLASVAVVFDCPYDPHNGAAVIRTCDAMGVQALHVVERGTPFKVSETVTRGAEKWVDVNCHSEASSAIRLLQQQGFEFVCAEADGELDSETCPCAW
jgi:tRNA (guanosine-2'-O-)-methyltransferase